MDLESLFRVSSSSLFQSNCEFLCVNKLKFIELLKRDNRRAIFLKGIYKESYNTDLWESMSVDMH